MISVICGNILNSIEDYIVHQCNCRTKSTKGLAEKIFKFIHTRMFIFISHLQKMSLLER